MVMLMSMLMLCPSEPPPAAMHGRPQFPGDYIPHCSRLARAVCPGALESYTGAFVPQLFNPVLTIADFVRQPVRSLCSAGLAWCLVTEANWVLRERRWARWSVVGAGVVAAVRGARWTLRAAAWVLSALCPPRAWPVAPTLSSPPPPPQPVRLWAPFTRREEDRPRGETGPG